jgi:hypothetical protein
MAIIILVPLSQNAQSEIGGCNSLSDFIDNISLGITRNEAITNFTSVNPIPKKLSEHIYGSLCVINNKTVLIGIFSFFSNKLALSMAEIMSLNNEVIDNLYDSAYKELSNSNITDKPICPTVDACTWKYYAIDYSISIGRVKNIINNQNVGVFVKSRRIDSLVSNSNITKSEYKKEMGEVINKLIINLPSGHKLHEIF